MTRYSWEVNFNFFVPPIQLIIFKSKYSRWLPLDGVLDIRR